MRLERGQLLETAGGDGYSDMQPPMLGFDFDAPAGVMGQTEPGTEVALMLRLGDGRVSKSLVDGDGGGTFRFSANNVRAGEDWALDDVMSVRVAIRRGKGHQIVRDMADAGGPLPSASPGANSPGPPAGRPTPGGCGRCRVILPSLARGRC